MKVTTAAELELMTMEERDAHLRASIERDIGNVPDEFLTAIRSRLRDRIETEHMAE